MITIFIAGDSTAANGNKPDSPDCGWGYVFGEYFNDGVKVENRAINGRSTKSFIDNGNLERIIDDSSPGDYLFIQFGHNDGKPDGERRTEPFTTYKQNLVIFIIKARVSSMIPVLLTPVFRRKFDADNRAVNTHGDFPAAMREAAADAGVKLIDMTAKTEKLLNELGADGTKKLFRHFLPGEYPDFPDGIEDDSHFSRYGAHEVSKLVVEGINEELPELCRYLTCRHI